MTEPPIFKVLDIIFAAIGIVLVVTIFTFLVWVAVKVLTGIGWL
jgi:hypothetical protein